MRFQSIRFKFEIWIFLLYFINLSNSTAQQITYCNPINIDYGYTPIPNFSTTGRHRATADPVIVNYKGDYFLFSTNQWGYWWSKDLSDWKFVSRKFLRDWHHVYDELCAPAVGIIGDTMLVFGSTYSADFTIWMSTNPWEDDWTPLVDSFFLGGWDPAFFTDTDGKLYMYNGSSNRYPLYGVELDRKTMFPKSSRKEMYFLESWRYGWQRFGEHQDDTFLDPFIEGAWMTKHGNRYYFQYAAPGTEFSGYADGVAVGNDPLGPFFSQSDPLSIKAGGFANGAGHGATFQDNELGYWHVSTIGICVKNNFERRLGLWPTGFDMDGVMWSNTAFGDYPHYLPGMGYPHGSRPDWYLLNYKKPVQVSSVFGAFQANHAVDENIKTYWCAATADSGEYILSDLGLPSDVFALQINYADQDVEDNRLGKWSGQFHKYQIFHSLDARTWSLLVDKSDNQKDVPHDYVQLQNPIRTRFLKLINNHMPTGKFAISGFRIFGKAPFSKPLPVKNLMVLRTEKDKRNAWIRWEIVPNAYAYNLYYGTHPDKLYSSLMIHDQNEYWFKGMDREKIYYFTIEAINEAGTSDRAPVLEVR